jgi:hypothetical protein
MKMAGPKQGVAVEESETKLKHFAAKFDSESCADQSSELKAKREAMEKQNHIRIISY